MGELFERHARPVQTTVPTEQLRHVRLSLVLRVKVEAVALKECRQLRLIQLLVSVEVMLLEFAPVRPLRRSAGGRLHLGLSPKARRAAA